jgi:16S rRNA (cytosine967-C5)-methyltransferase
MAIYGHANIKHELMGISALLSILLVFKQASARSCFLHPTPLFLKQGSRTTRSTPTRSTTTTTFSRIRATKTSLSSTNTQNESQSQSTLNPRYLAAQALTQRKKQKDLDAVSRLESTQAFLNSSQRDKAFARNLVSTTSRRLGQIDSVLSQCCNTYPPKGKQGAIVQACLRIGAAQLLFLDTPAFAAVKETIDVLKNRGFHVPKPMVSFSNAVLRRVEREGVELLQETDVCDNISDFLKGEFRNLYGEEDTEKIVGQLLDENAHHFVDLTLKDGDISVQDVIDSFEADDDERFDSVSPLSNGSIRIGKGPNAGAISNWPLYEEGAWWVQDVSSTLPAIALTKALHSKFGETHNKHHVVDMCAAPGGKTAQLLSAGFRVTAIEANARRSRRLLENLQRLQFGEDQCHVVVSPGQEWLPKDNGEDLQVAGILVDVPCSATGTGNKRPDVLRKDGDLGNLLDTQEILANHCADNILQSGGVMVYATCSLLAMESEDQVHKLLKRGTMKTLPFTKGEIPGFDDAIDANGWLRVLPGVLGGELRQCDGFFVARLEKV